LKYGDLYKQFDDQKGVQRTLSNDLTFDQLEVWFTSKQASAGAQVWPFIAGRTFTNI
jgi:hypothetical protein